MCTRTSPDNSSKPTLLIFACPSWTEQKTPSSSQGKHREQWSYKPTDYTIIRAASHTTTIQQHATIIDMKHAAVLRSIQPARVGPGHSLINHTDCKCTRLDSGASRRTRIDQPTDDRETAHQKVFLETDWQVWDRTRRRLRSRQVHGSVSRYSDSLLPSASGNEGQSWRQGVASIRPVIIVRLHEDQLRLHRQSQANKNTVKFLWITKNLSCRNDQMVVKHQKEEKKV